MLNADCKANLDSLYNIWLNNTQDDSSRVAAYKEYIWQEHLFSNPDSAFTLATGIIDFSQQQNYQKGIATGFHLQGVATGLQGNYSSALDYFSNSLKVNENIDDSIGIANSLHNIGNIYKYQGNSLKALDYFSKSMAIYEDTDDKRGFALNLNYIGSIHKDLLNYKVALNYYSRSIDIFEQLDDQWGIALNLLYIGEIHKEKENYHLALDYFIRSLKIFENKDDHWGTSVNLNNIGETYKASGNTAEAKKYFYKVLNLSEKTGHRRNIGTSYTNIGLIHQENFKYTKSIEYCKKGFEVAKEIGVLKNQQDACQCLYDSFKLSGNSTRALDYLEKIRIIEDSLHLQETSMKLQQMEFQKKTIADSLSIEEEKLQVQLAHKSELVRKNKTRNALLGSGLLLLFLSIGMFNRWNYIKKSKSIIEIERDRSDKLLLNILPAEIAQELKETGKSPARSYDSVSILFTDFVGFTQLAEKLSPSKLVAEVNSCFTAFDGICDKYNLEKIKTIGDSYMAAGGLIHTNKDSVRNTVLAAIEMQEYIQNRNAIRLHENHLFLQMRIGINTGPVVAGIVGDKKFQYDLWGDSVNTASRMETEGEAGLVNISLSTYNLLKGDPLFDFQKRGRIKAKGKGEIEMFFVKKATPKLSSIPVSCFSLCG